MNCQLHAPAALFPGKERLRGHWVGAWVGPRVDLDTVAKRSSCPFRELNLGYPVRSLVVTLTELLSFD